MGKFKSRPSAELKPVPDTRAVEQFAAGANTRTVEVPPTHHPWDGLDPKAKATSGINVRLNDYELALLRFVAESDDRSIQKTIKRLLIPAIESEAQRLEG